MSKKILEVGSDEDGETYYCIGDVKERSAKIAIRAFQRDECGLYGDDLLSMSEALTKTNFRKSVDCPHGGEHEGYFWWGTPKPDEKTEPIGVGWIYRI